MFANVKLKSIKTMKKLAVILIALLPVFAMAKNDKKDNSNPKYLAGAITLTDGKVTFSEEIKTPSMSKSELFNTMLEWANERFSPENTINSRVVYTNEEKGEIVGSGEEYMVFSSTALSLDRTRIYYYFLIEANEGSCKVSMNRIRYWYDENRDGGEKYNAEEWITDDMALNRSKTKLAPICGKFRRETIDLKDDLFKSVKDYLGQKNLDDAGNSNISSKIEEVNTINQNGELKSVTVNQLPSNINEIIFDGRITITVGEEEIDVKSESWGGFGKLFNKDVAYTIVDNTRMAVSLLMENSDKYKISVYKRGKVEPYIIIECKKTMTQKLSSEELKSLNIKIDSNKEYTMYIGEVISAQIR